MLDAKGKFVDGVEMKVKKNKQMTFTPLVSQPNCNLLSGSHNRSLPVLSLAVETGEALVLEVLDVHGLLDNPGHGVLVLGQHSDPELGRISVKLLNTTY